MAACVHHRTAGVQSRWLIFLVEILGGARREAVRAPRCCMVNFAGMTLRASSKLVAAGSAQTATWSPLRNLTDLAGAQRARTVAHAEAAAASLSASPA